MNVSLIPFLAGWLTLASFVVGLAIYRKLISMREDDTLHVLDKEPHRLKQASLAQRLDTIDHWGKILTIVVTALGVLLAVAYLCEVWIASFSQMWR